jgi:uncharacterized membrane protein YfcA
MAVLCGFGVGILSGTMGVGGGILLVPALVLGFGLPQQLAQGTSLAAIVPTALVGGLSHLRRGNVLIGPAAWMGALGVAGALAGALLALSLPRDVLGRLFGVLLLYSAYRVWPRAQPATA